MNHLRIDVRLMICLLSCFPLWLLWISNRILLSYRQNQLFNNYPAHINSKLNSYSLFPILFIIMPKKAPESLFFILLGWLYLNKLKPFFVFQPSEQEKNLKRFKPKNLQEGDRKIFKRTRIKFYYNHNRFVYYTMSSDRNKPKTRSFASGTP